ncbi:MAG TPA: hypothetical protein VFS47_17105 [Steroidobacteraceae bacterium]|jgi:hypothetical protein|nr:hypothetical protein [Steroidobacteraceae bacterium]
MKTQIQIGFVAAAIFTTSIASAQVFGGGGLTGSLGGSLNGAMNDSGLMMQGIGNGALGADTGTFSRAGDRLGERTRTTRQHVRDRTTSTIDSAKTHAESLGGHVNERVQSTTGALTSAASDAGSTVDQAAAAPNALTGSTGDSANALNNTPAIADASQTISNSAANTPDSNSQPSTTPSLPLNATNLDQSAAGSDLLAARSISGQGSASGSANASRDGSSATANASGGPSASANVSK